MLLSWQVPVHYNDTISLINSWDYQQKTTKIYSPIIEGATPSIFQQHPSQKQMMTAESCSAESWEMLQRGNRKQHPNYTDYRWTGKLIAPIMQAGIGTQVSFFRSQIQQNPLPSVV